ncbi:hypothetical protein [Methylobacter sp. BlB1]|jgi:hypothetical protein|uniref:hypothetical protein n=1 Tax=Methylobacter sp. BlB1 TaxID=2785914 RepID=UPI001895FAA6|nr:hypothetical protein [Methylobacter sp. BlB1]MBF6647477.1 hypothetical protein [Methylobacter sp. BlB1]
MLLNWIREKMTLLGLNDQETDNDESDIGFDFALSFDMVDQLSSSLINDPGIRAFANANKVKLLEH